MSIENSPNPLHWGKLHPTRGRQTHSRSWGCGCTCTGPPSDRKMVQTHTAWGGDGRKAEQMSFLDLDKRLPRKGWKLDYRWLRGPRKLIKQPSLEPTEYSDKVWRSVLTCLHVYSQYVQDDSHRPHVHFWAVSVASEDFRGWQKRRWQRGNTISVRTFLYSWCISCFLCCFPEI